MMGFCWESAHSPHLHEIIQPHARDDTRHRLEDALAGDEETALATLRPISQRYASASVSLSSSSTTLSPAHAVCLFSPSTRIAT